MSLVRLPAAAAAAQGACHGTPAVRRWGPASRGTVQTLSVVACPAGRPASQPPRVLTGVLKFECTCCPCYALGGSSPSGSSSSSPCSARGSGCVFTRGRVYAGVLASGSLLSLWCGGVVVGYGAVGWTLHAQFPAPTNKSTHAPIATHTRAQSHHTPTHTHKPGGRKL